MSRRLVGGLLMVGMACGALAVADPDGASSPAAAAAPPVDFPHPSRVAVLVLENRSFDQVIGSRQAPYLNRLARRYALETRYYALTHPSLPNYVALTAGTTSGISGDCSACDSDHSSLLNQLTAHHVSWRAYFQSLPRDPAAPVTPRGRYDKHYNPFVYEEGVSGKPALRAQVSGFHRLRLDLARHSLARFSWIAPDVRYDGHDHPLAAADRLARRVVPRLLNALGRRGVLYLTWDEGKRTDRAGLSGSPGGGRVALIAAGGVARRHARVSVAADHYALLRTIEANFGLRPLGHAGSRSTPLLGGLLRGVG